MAEVAQSGSATTAQAQAQAHPSSSTSTRPPNLPQHHRSSSLASTISGAQTPTTPTSGSNSKFPNAHGTRARGTLGTAGRPLHHRQALSAIRAFLRRESCFDILPESFRLIVFDNKLLIKRALVALQTNGEWEESLFFTST